MTVGQRFFKTEQNNYFNRKGKATMTYKEIVLSNQTAIQATGFLKMAQDLASILDEKCLSSDIEKMNHSTIGIAEKREKVFDRFCTICAKAGIKIPEYEPLFYLAPLYGIHSQGYEKEKKNEETLVEYVQSQLVGKHPDSAGKIKTLVEVMQIFPNPGYNRIDDKKIYAMINSLLVEIGCKPFRPDYSKNFLRNPVVPEPVREFKVLIVDDGKSEILQTAKELAGWPKMTMDFFLVEEDLEKSESARPSEIAQQIILRKPDIILMDYSMGDIKGDELIILIKGCVNCKILFVGNTGGSDDWLRKVGAFENCQKGMYFRGLIQAINCLENQVAC